MWPLRGNITDVLVVATYLILTTTVFLLAETLKHWLAGKNYAFLTRVDHHELARKLAHVLCGIAIALLPMTGASVIAAVAIGCIVLITLTVGAGWFVDSSFCDFLFTKRRGSAIFAAALIVMALIFYDNTFRFQAAFAVLAFADPAAAIFGLVFGKRRLFSKTLVGSLVHLAVACAVLCPMMAVKFGSQAMWVGLPLGLIVTAIELSARNGWDNLFVPLATASALSLVGL